MIKSIMNKKRLQLVFDAGMSGGKEKTKLKTFNNIDLQADKENLYLVGRGLASLQSLDLLDIKENLENILIDE